jgi:hypothetical protein
VLRALVFVQTERAANAASDHAALFSQENGTRER